MEPRELFLKNCQNMANGIEIKQDTKDPEFLERLDGESCRDFFIRQSRALCGERSRGTFDKADTLDPRSEFIKKSKRLCRTDSHSQGGTWDDDEDEGHSRIVPPGGYLSGDHIFSATGVCLF